MNHSIRFHDGRKCHRNLFIGFPLWEANAVEHIPTIQLAPHRKVHLQCKDRIQRLLNIHFSLGWNCFFGQQFPIPRYALGTAAYHSDLLALKSPQHYFIHIVCNEIVPIHKPNVLAFRNVQSNVSGR